MFSNLGQFPRPCSDDDRKVGLLPTLEISPSTAMRPLISPEKLAFWKEYFASPLAARAPVF